jgi:hypothetical protein
MGAPPRTAASAAPTPRGGLACARHRRESSGSRSHDARRCGRIRVAWIPSFFAEGLRPSYSPTRAFARAGRRQDPSSQPRRQALALEQPQRPPGLDLRLAPAMLQHFVLVRSAQAMPHDGKPELGPRRRQPPRLSRRVKRGREILEIELMRERAVEPGHDVLPRVEASVEGGSDRVGHGHRGPRRCTAEVRHGGAARRCITGVHHKGAPQRCTTKVHHKGAPRRCTTEVHHKGALRKVHAERCTLRLHPFVSGPRDEARPFWPFRAVRA